MLVFDASTGATGRTWMAFGETVGTGDSYKGYWKKETGPEEENGGGGGSEEEEEKGEGTAMLPVVFCCISRDGQWERDGW